eukprot:CAMPEP_0194589814 /NCGR_PEP_ID=MMETSP0292-20121207/20899_1 /TAXON_ID=39354 /ORGANISM="Heterosigma akashiwo, Strain CCMP2393" /LENGTH=215 /DNA_ID=CAMNT_0039447179 /DNA_START=247 /DNA_END=891 /DNA_ORIENTATION=+
MRVGFTVNSCSHPRPFKKQANDHKYYDYYCLDAGHWRNKAQAQHAAFQDILAGHFFYGIHRMMNLKEDPVYMTTLRNPLTRAASAALYWYHEEKGKKINGVSHAAQIIQESFSVPIENGIHSPRVPEMLARLTGSARTTLRPDSKEDQDYIKRKLDEVKSNLDGFKLVGLTEKFDVFVDMFVDGLKKGLWGQPTEASRGTWEQVLQQRGKKSARG